MFTVLARHIKKEQQKRKSRTAEVLCRCGEMLKGCQYCHYLLGKKHKKEVSVAATTREKADPMLEKCTNRHNREVPATYNIPVQRILP